MSFAVLPANAQTDPQIECAAAEVSRSGRPWRLKIAAKKGARDAWKQKVANDKKLGNNYSAWFNAKKGDDPYSCHRTKDKKKWICKASATPCRSLMVWHSPGRVCSPYQYNGTGEPHKYEFIAKNNARRAWKARVKEIVGPKFDTWTFSHSKSNDCTEKDGKYTCTAKAKPCRISLKPFKDEKGKLEK
jgi:hypothetical protein